MERIKIPLQILQRLSNAAPSYLVSENEGRSSGYYCSDRDESAAGYKAICIYVQNGLADYFDLFVEIARGVFKIQAENQRRYPLVVFGFGQTDYLQHEKKFFDFGFINDSNNDKTIAEAISRISGSLKCNPAIITEFFPKTDIRSLYTGKTRIEREDLLIIIGRGSEIFISESLRDKITDSFKKQILLVEIGKNDVTFKVRGINFEFKSFVMTLTSNTIAKSPSNFKRNFSSSLVAAIEGESFYQILKPEILDQKVFPGIRNNIIDFYFKGGRLFKFDDKGFQTHIKYAAVIEKDKRDYLTEKELGNYKLATDFSKNYTRIKENCSIYAGVEANGVSEIYHRHSYVGRDRGIVILDIEVSLKSISPDNSQDRIDILLFNADERKLKFVEVKHYSNSEIWSNQVAKVIGQIKRYEAQIHLNKTDIILEYNKYIDIVNEMFSGNLPHVVDIDEKVTLLVFGFDNDQKYNRLEKLITKNPKFNDIQKYCIGNINKIKLAQLWKAK